MTNKDFTFYPKAEYYRDIVQRMQKLGKGDRVALASMGFEPYLPEVEEVVEALGKAAERGAEATLLVDAYIFLNHEKLQLGPLFFFPELPPRLFGPFRICHEFITRLREQGVRVAVTNQPHRAFTSPVSGRSHIKFAVINGRLYIGGCNLTTVKHLDVMVGWNDKTCADWLYDFAEDMLRNEGSKFMRGIDRKFTADASTELLIDSGKPKQSIIFKKALQLVDEAEKEVLITCQYFPNSVTTKHLIKAHNRGVKVTVIYNHPSKFRKPHNLLQHAVVARERLRTPPILFKQQLPKDRHYLHAKIIATEKAAIIGSHNYVTAGVNFGTAEIALLRHDPAFAEQAIHFTEQMTTVSNGIAQLPPIV